MEKDIRIAVIGLGYVGLPLFCLISNHFTCKGLDNDSNRISLLKEVWGIERSLSLIHI